MALRPNEKNKLRSALSQQVDAEDWAALRAIWGDIDTGIRQRINDAFEAEAWATLCFYWGRAREAITDAGQYPAQILPSPTWWDDTRQVLLGIAASEGITLEGI